MRVISTIKFTFLRMIREYITLLLLFVVPIVLLTVFYFILQGVTTETGEPVFNEHAVLMVLVFQLFGGSLVMHYIQSDFFTGIKQRIYLLPFNQTLYAFSIMVCGVVYSLLLGIVLMTFSQLVLGADWGNWPWAVYMIFLMSLLSSIVCLIFTFSVNNFKVAERLSEVYGVGFVLLAGLLFPVPENAFFEFVNSYANPLTLSAESIYNMNQSSLGEAWFQSNILLIASVVLFIVLLILGKRKMR
ncbi:ABC transporter permease [Virgibacillus oceani]